MSFGIVGQIGKCNYPFEISPMPMDIAGNDQAAFSGQMNHIAAPKFICIEDFDTLVQ
jgi:hypothetical protein